MSRIHQDTDATWPAREHISRCLEDSQRQWGPAKPGRYPWQASRARQKQKRPGEPAVAHLGKNHLSGSALALHHGGQAALLGRYYRSGTLAQRFTPEGPLRSSSREIAARMGTASREQGFSRVTRAMVGQSLWASLTLGVNPQSFPKGQARRPRLMWWKVTHVGTRVTNAHYLFFFSPHPVSLSAR